MQLQRHLCDCQNWSVAEREPKGSPPEFVIKIKPSKVKEGEVADFSCQVIGEPAPELTWFFNRQPLEGAGRYTLVQKNELQVRVRAKEDDSVILWCNQAFSQNWMIHNLLCYLCLWGDPNTTLIRALCCNPSGCGFKSSSDLCLWDLFPWGVPPRLYVMSRTSIEAKYNKSTTLLSAGCSYSLFSLLWLVLKLNKQLIPTHWYSEISKWMVYTDHTWHIQCLVYCGFWGMEPFDCLYILYSICFVLLFCNSHIW